MSFFHLIWYVGIVLEAAIVVLLIVKKELPRWPSIFAYCLADLIADVLVAQSSGNYAFRFYTYWIWHFASAAIRLWVLADVLRSIKGATFLRRDVGFFVVTVGFVLAALCLGIGLKKSDSVALGIIAAIGRYELAVAFVWVAFFASFLTAAKIYRLPWTFRGAILSNGLGIKAGAALCVSFVLSYAPSYFHFTDELQSAAAIACLGCWIIAFASRDRQLELDAATQIDLRALVAKLPAR